ncbi:MAG: TonB family protein [Burkholderiales bacterium]
MARCASAGSTTDLRRLGLALVASAILHGILAILLSDSSRQGRVAPAALHARLTEDMPGTSVADPPPPPATGEAVTSTAARDGAGVQPQPKATTHRPDSSTSPVKRRSSAAPAAATVPRDPTWYSARELDELPRPLKPIRAPRVASSGAPGRIVLRLAIDETGTVIDASVLDADARGDLASPALAAARAARFRPGTKGGRIVKSKVLVELTFVPDGSGNL